MSWKLGSTLQRRAGIGAAIFAIVGSIYVSSALWRASRAVSESAAAAQVSGALRFEAIRLDRHPALGFEPLSAAAMYEDVAIFHGHIFVCGATGLAEFDGDGNSVARYRTGYELPPAPLVRLHTGVAADAQEPELYIASQGEGLLAYDGRRFRQIRPNEPGLGKLTAVLVGTNGKVLMGTAKDGVLA